MSVNIQILATLIQAGSQIAAEYIRSRPVKTEPVSLGQPEELQFEPTAKVIESDVQISETKPTKMKLISQTPTEDKKDFEFKAQAIPTGCIPCSLGHLGACSGLLNEAMRFARADGVASDEVIDRANMCLDELNALERTDLRPEMINGLPEWEHDIAVDALNLSRQTRHYLENVNNIDQFEKVAAEVQAKRNDIGRRWFQGKLSHLSDEEKAKIQERVMDKVSKINESTSEEASEE